MSLAPQTAALQRLTAQQAWHYRALPLQFDGTRLRLAVAPGGGGEAAEELAILTGLEIELLEVAEGELQPALASHYRRDERSRPPAASAAGFLEGLFEEAVAMRASDIHLEPQRDSARVRLRVDGRLLERFELALEEYPRYVNQIKVRAGLDISQRMLPQDGRVRLAGEGAGGGGLDVRVSTLPTLYGEKVVMRLLGRSAVELDLGQLGMTGDQLRDFRLGTHAETGIIVVSGPTGSGKTTTLYAALNELNDVGVNITTLEDPIEYTLPGVNQVQTNPAVGFTFELALSTFMRQDPNIIMLGEIRDAASAQVATRASLTGHLVLATLHTNSAIGIVPRLVDMGIPAYKLADTLNTLVAQRLLRRLCDRCKRVDPAAPATPFAAGSELFTADGCPACHYTGYRGRVAAHEVIRVDADLRDAIRAGAVGKGYAQDAAGSLAARARDLVVAGVTSWREAAPLLAEEQ